MAERAVLADEQLSTAIDEIQTLIRAQYPEARFDVSTGPEPGDTYLIATVNVDDADDVMDVYIERLVEYQVENRLPLYVMSLRPDDEVRQSLPLKTLDRAPLP